MDGNDPPPMTTPQFNQEWSPDVLIYTDASVDEDGGTAVAYTLQTPEEELICDGGYRIESTSKSHVAEYVAVLKGVSVANERGYEDPVIYTDYEGVVNHVFGEATFSDKDCNSMKEKLTEFLQSKFNKWMLEHIPRELNTPAHSLANTAVSPT